MTISSQAPLKVKKLYQGNVLDLSCDLGYYLKVNISSNSDSNELTSSLQTVSAFSYNTLRVYCVVKNWKMDNLSAQSDTGIVPRIPLLSPPFCDGLFLFVSLVTCSNV